MKEVKVENDELWSMKLLKASLNGVKILLWPLRVFVSFLMRRRDKPDGTKGIAPAEILFVIFIAGIVVSFVYGTIFKDFADALMQTIALSCVVCTYYMIFYQLKEIELDDDPAGDLMPFILFFKALFFILILVYIVMFYTFMFRC